MVISFEWWSTLGNLILIVNVFLALSILFFERKKVSSTWAWIMILFFLPVVGFILYLLFGKPLSEKKRKHHSVYSYPELQKLLDSQLQEIDDGSFVHTSSVTEEFQDIIRMQLKSEVAPLSTNNQFHIYTDGKSKFNALLQDVEDAQKHIHLEYFILKNDEIGNHLLALLTKKANQGVKVLFLYDDVGSKTLPKHFFADLVEAGGRAEPTLTSKIPFVNLRFNFRNHRKIAIIDGEIGYIGGFNVGDEYLGGNRKFGYWRDTHIRLEGNVVHSLQNRFLLDWNQASRKYPVKYTDTYFPSSNFQKGAAMQIVASGPDEPTNQIKNGFFKLIVRARKSIYIQTPYFIPDEAILEALRTAALSGIDIRIMLPNKADHILTHAANLSFAEELLTAGAKVYQYDNGFLHAKTLMIDRKVFTIGSANLDVRSFSLNFEANAFVYDQEATEEIVDVFFRDLKLSSELTTEYFENRSLYERVKQRLARLIAPIL